MITCTKDGLTTTFETGFLKISFIGVGITGGCPAEKDNDGCFYGTDAESLVPPETITANKEFCDCVFTWKFAHGDGHGESFGVNTIPAIAEPCRIQYPAQELTARNAASITCEQMLGQYKVVFHR